ncbi:glycoside hydrolase [bacterium]|nr:glycoside hydrolase [bacterium]
MIHIVDQGILYRNPLPQLQPVHASFPFIIQISENEFLCTFRRGSAWESADGVICRLRSTDGGRTWIDEGVIWDGSGDDRPYSYRTGAMTRLSDGTLLMTSCRFDRSDPEKPIYNPLTEGYLPVDAALFRSTDGGRTWSLPQSVSLPEGEIGNPAGPVIELSDGRWLMPFETWKAYDDPHPARQRTVALFSGDRGKTWGDRTTIADGHEHGIVYWDSTIVPVEDGRLVSLLWTRNMKADKDLALHRTISDNNGATWSAPEPVGVMGHTTALVNIGGGCLCMLYSLRAAEQPGIMVILSENEGKTWYCSTQVMIWDARGQSHVGTAARDRCLADMATYAFGKPQAILTSDDDILAGFWCTVACVTHIRWCRLRITYPYNG